MFAAALAGLTSLEVVRGVLWIDQDRFGQVGERPGAIRSDLSRGGARIRPVARLAAVDRAALEVGFGVPRLQADRLRKVSDCLLQEVGARRTLKIEQSPSKSMP